MNDEQRICLFGVIASLMLCCFGIYYDDLEIAIFSTMMFNAALTLGVVEVIKELFSGKGVTDGDQEES